VKPLEDLDEALGVFDTALFLGGNLGLMGTRERHKSYSGNNCVP
jgi:hypothetical protein